MKTKNKVAAPNARSDARRSPAAARAVTAIEKVIQNRSNPVWLAELQRCSSWNKSACVDSIFAPFESMPPNLQLPTPMFVLIQDSLLNEDIPVAQRLMLCTVANVCLSQNPPQVLR